jgi:hypothetical protein
MKKYCQECQKLFTLKHPAQKMCSEKCKNKAIKRSMKIYLQRVREIIRKFNKGLN